MSLTGQQSSTKSLTGLSDTYSTNIVCETLEVSDEFTCDPGCIITLPPASIQDSYLTANVAFRNQVNAFTLGNSFASTTTHNGTTTNNGTSNFNSTVNVLNGTIQNFFSAGGTSNSRIQQTATGLQLVNGTPSQSIGIYTRTAGGVVGANLICQNGNTVYLQGDAANRITVSGSTTPVLTIQAPAISNDFSIANTAWVVSQGYAKLAGPQTFTGNHNFPTQLTTDNSTLVATTAYVKNNLLDYGRLTLATGATLQTWFGINRFSSNSANLPLTFQNTDVPTYGGGIFIPSGGGQYNATNQVGDLSLLSTGTGASNTGALSLTTWSSTNCGIRINNNTITYNGPNHYFNGNISLGLYNFDILNSARTRGMRISNNGANNGTTDIEGVGVSTRFNFFSSDGTGTRLNNFYISGSNTCYLQGSAGLGIGMVGSAISLDGVCSFTNTTTPVITQTIATADNSTKIATTAWVRLQNYITTAALSGYALLAGPQTFTGNQNFPTPATSDNNTLAATTAFVKNQNYITSSALSPYALLAGPQTFTGNQNFPTPATIDNSTLAATTAFVKNQNYITSSALSPYALLNPTTTQTFAGTGDNVFSNIVTCTSGLNSNSNITLLSGALSSNIRQNTLGLEITNVDTSKYIKLITRTSGGATVDNLTCENGNNTKIRGSLTMENEAINCKDVLGGASFTQLYQSGSGFSITPNHSSSSVSLWSRTSGGVSVENIKCQNGNSNLVKGSITMLNDGIVFNDVGGGANSTSIYQTGIACSITNNFNNGSVRLNTKNGSGVGQDGVYCLDGNRAGLQGNSGKTIEVNGNNCTIACDNFRSDAPFECGYLQLGTPITAKTNYDIGYVWSVQGSSFNSWNGFTSYGNVYTLVWDGSGDKTYGVWRCDICIATQTSSAMDSGFVFSTTNNFVINTRSTWSNALTSFGVNQAQICRLSCTLNITNLTDTYYLNFKINGGSSRSDLTGASQMLFTRIA
jgi:hypothetical protein